MRCPITYEALEDQTKKYSQKGLRLLSKNITDLKDFPLSRKVSMTQTQVTVAERTFQEMSPQFNVYLNAADEVFEVTTTGGTFILKTQNMLWPALPENEDLTMRLAKSAGLEVPLHGLVYDKDGALAYWMRRFDRPSLKSPGRLKYACEDFAQLSGLPKHQKYQSTMEKAADIIETFATFPVLEKEKFFRLTLFNFLVGNGDAHLKSLSLLTENQVIKLSPVYDLINTHIIMGDARQEEAAELALPLNGKINQLKSRDFIDYFAIQCLKISQTRIKKIVKQIILATKKWPDIIHHSFLPLSLQEEYIYFVNTRLKQLLS